MAIPQTTPREYAIQTLAPSRLHRCIWLPASSTHGRLRLTYSTTSNFDQNLPAILFVGPMFGNRYIASVFNRQACISGVRVIFVDRPGFGGSTAVPLEERMGVWLETIPVLLQHLNVQHVSLVTHSAGTTFTLNTLAKLRHILDPKGPYVAFMAPWVNPAHSRMALWSAATKLPSGIISGWSGLNQFIATNILPAAAWSGSVSASFADLFQSQSPIADPGESSYREKYGVDDETGKEIEMLATKYAFTEGMSGGNDEARLCLGHADWLACKDYMACVKSLADTEQRRLREDVGGPRLTVRLHFAASDVMIGEGGKQYFEDCWKQDEMSEVFDLESKRWTNTNHDSVLVDLQNGAIKSIFKDVSNMSRADSS